MGSHQWSFVLSRRMMKSIFVACVVAVASAEPTGDAFNGAFHAYTYAGHAPFPHPYGAHVFKRSADSDSFLGYGYASGYAMDSLGFNNPMNYGYAAGTPFGFHSMGKRSSDSEAENESYSSNSNNNNNAPITFDYGMAAVPFAYAAPAPAPMPAAAPQGFEFAAPAPRPFGYAPFPAPAPAPFNPGMRAYGFGK